MVETGCTEDPIYYHHFSLVIDSKELRQLTERIRFVLVAGCPQRVEEQGRYLVQNLFNGEELPKHDLRKLTNDKSRFCLFNLGPVLLANHGMGASSMSIALHELFCMCQQANSIEKITLIRFGTCGGVGVEPGTLCITKRAVDPLFRDYIELPICGKLVRRDCRIDQETVQIFEELAQKNFTSQGFEIRSGTTIATNDFYEEQGRTNGAICEHTNEDKMRFLKSAHDLGVINIEMESNYLSAMAHKLNVKHAVIAVALANRLLGDQILMNHDQLADFESRLYLLNSAFIKHKLANNCV